MSYTIGSAQSNISALTQVMTAKVLRTTSLAVPSTHLCMRAGKGMRMAQERLHRGTPFCMTIRLKIIMEFLQNLNFRAKDTMSQNSVFGDTQKKVGHGHILARS